MATYAEYSYIYSDNPPSLEEIQSYFKRFKTSHLIQLFCKANIALWKVRNKYNELAELQNYLIKMFFSADEIEKLKQAWSRDEKKALNVIFHRHQVLLAIKLLLLNPNEEGEVINDFHDFGRYFLAISQHLNSPPMFIYGRFDSQDFAYTRKEVARLNYFTHYGNFVNNFSRALDQWIETPKTPRGEVLLKEINFNPEEEFLNETGLSIEEYLNLNFLYLANLFRLDYKTNNPNDFMIPSNYLSSTNLSQEKQDLLLDSIVQVFGDYRKNDDLSRKNKFNEKEIFVNDFLSLIEKPVIRVNNGYLITADPAFFEEKIASGPYWILLNRFFRLEGKDSKKAKDLSKYFGLLHQEYVYKVLLNICDEVIEVEVKPNEEVKTCDFMGVIKKGEEIYLLIVEAKKIALGLDILLFSERDDTISSLRRVFGEKGFGQIYSTIELIQAGKIDEVKHIPLNKVKAIFPLLLTDRFIVEETLNRKLYEEELFNPLLYKYKLPDNITVANPIFISSEEMEVIEASQNSNPELSLLKFLGHRHTSLNKRYYREQKQILPGLILADLGWLVDHLNPVWNELYLVGYSKFENNRLKKIYDQQFPKLKQSLFGVSP